MKCQKCNKEIISSSKFCEFCGIKINKNIRNHKQLILIVLFFAGLILFFGTAYLHQKNKIADCVLKNIGKPPTVHSSDNDSRWKTVNGRISQEQLLDNYNAKLKQQSEFCADLKFCHTLCIKYKRIIISNTTIKPHKSHHNAHKSMVFCLRDLKLLYKFVL